MRKQPVKLIVNEDPYELFAAPNETLLDLLRDGMDLTGTKCNCRAGECGACVVLIDGKPVLSCLTLAVTVQGKKVTTIEGLAKGNSLHPLQRAFIDSGAIQCGFCTPGMILTAKAFLDENPHPTVEEVKSALSGNLCRCGGYVKIIEAVMAAAEENRKADH
jgi:aerobic carbon-monoxide dehydrogenase small subunit